MLSTAAEMQAQLENERHQEFHTTKADSHKFWGSAQDQLREFRLSQAEALRRSHCNDSDDADTCSTCCSLKESAPKQVSAKVLLTAASSPGASSVEELPQAERRKQCRVRLALPKDEPMDELQDTTAQQTAAAGAIGNDFRVSSFSRGVISTGIAGLEQGCSRGVTSTGIAGLEQGCCDLHPMEA